MVNFTLWEGLFYRKNESIDIPSYGKITWNFTAKDIVKFIIYLLFQLQFYKVLEPQIGSTNWDDFRVILF